MRETKNGADVGCYANGCSTQMGVKKKTKQEEKIRRTKGFYRAHPNISWTIHNT